MRTRFETLLATSAVEFKVSRVAQLSERHNVYVDRRPTNRTNDNHNWVGDNTQIAFPIILLSALVSLCPIDISNPIRSTTTLKRHADCWQDFAHFAHSHLT